ncbi:MAG: UDP-diphosphatase [Bacteroidetes bacterium SW_11_45_7]|nr:MAG: UDP-diphosphatase [Bacteroidetes bacterium SW_11_45_7]
MTTLEALILGIVQGLTEFLPISSSGHIELGKELLGVQSKKPLVFMVLVHGATVLSTIVVFYRQIGDIIKGAFRFQWNEETEYIAKILVSMIPVAIIGVFFKDQVEYFFEGRIMWVGIMLLVTALLLWATTLTRGENGKRVNFPKALLIGIGQALAVMPGISRSGATISTALLLKVDRYRATQFSFLMVLIPILGQTALQVKDILSQSGSMQGLNPMSLLVGFVAAFVSGLFACRWMVQIVRRGKILYFSLYCLIIGSIAIYYGWS